MIIEKMPLVEAEEKYLFAQSNEVSMKTGLLGHLRADFGSSGQLFYSTWFDFRSDLKTQEFKDEFDEIINSLREKGDFLHSINDMVRYCYENPDMKLNERYRENEYGVRIDTDQYSYLMRLNPRQGDYNLYCYCYKRGWLNLFLKNASKGIRFIDSRYRELFRIADGEYIVVHSPVSGDSEYMCRYIDDSHVEVGDNIYHICEFAEFLERNGATCEPKGGSQKC